MEGIEADLGGRGGGAHGLLIAAVHVDRDRPDRCSPVAQLGEEGLQGLGVAARPGPHDGARGVVADGGQVALPAAVGDLVDADHHQPVQAVLIEVVGDHTGHDRPDGVPADPEQPSDRGLGHLLGQKGREVLEVARVARARSGPWQRLNAHAAVRTAHPPQLVLDEAALAAEIEVAPAPASAVMNGPADLAAARANRAPAPQRDRHDHPVHGEADIANERAGQAQQPVQCRGDAHVVLLETQLSFDTQQPPRPGGRARRRPAQLPRPRSRAAIPRLSRTLWATPRARASTQTTGDPFFQPLPVSTIGLIDPAAPVRSSDRRHRPAA